MDSDSHTKHNRISVFKYKGKDEDVSKLQFYAVFLLFFIIKAQIHAVDFDLILTLEMLQCVIINKCCNMVFKFFV